MSIETPSVKTIAAWDGSSPNRRSPDWWEEQLIREVGGTVYLQTYHMGQKHLLPLRSLSDALERCPWMADEEIEAVAAAFAA